MKIRFILSVTIALCACRSPKETKKINNTSTDSTAQHRSYEWQFIDSTGRYWYYRTDGTFFFHPDSGLFGNGGVLRIQESLLHQFLLRQSNDSTARHTQENKVSWVSDASKHGWRRWVSYVVSAAVGLLLFFFDPKEI